MNDEAAGTRKSSPGTRALVVMARRPAAGVTKTRLCPPLDATRAAELYEAFLADTLATARKVGCEGRFVAYTPDSESVYFKELAPGFNLLPQGEGTLGDRLDRVMGRCLGKGYGMVVALGSDSPTLPSSHVDRAFYLLRESEMVLGPCEDGGYYLAGLNRPGDRIFGRVTMSTPRVLADTVGLAQRLGWSHRLAPSHWDVDRGEDLMRLQRDLAAAPETVAPATRRALASCGWQAPTLRPPVGHRPPASMT